MLLLPCGSYYADRPVRPALRRRPLFMPPKAAFIEGAPPTKINASIIAATPYYSEGSITGRVSAGRRSPQAQWSASGSESVYRFLETVYTVILAPPPGDSVHHLARPWACTHNGPSSHPEGARFEVFCVHRGSASAGCTQLSEKTVYDLLPVSSTVHRMELSKGIFIDQADKNVYRQRISFCPYTFLTF